MPEKKVINSAVRLDESVDRGEGKAVGHATRTFGPGQEEDLAKAASKKQLQYLTNQGAIAGFGAKPEKGSPADLANVTIFQPDEESGIGGGAPPAGAGAGAGTGGGTPPAGGAAGTATGTTAGGSGAPPAGGAPAGGAPPAGTTGGGAPASER